MKKTLIGMATAVAAFASLPMAANAADCGEVTITEMNWPSSAVVTEVSKFLMEQGYGCKVTKVPSSTTPAITSIAETGKPDIATEVWTNSVPFYRDLEAEGKVLTAANVLSDGGEEGWWIPQYLAEKHPELTTIEGIVANPQLVGNRFHDCPDGWGCATVNGYLAKAFGLDTAGFELFKHGSGETLATSIAAAYGDKAPWFGYYWAPTSVLGKYPMVKVDMGPVDPAAFECMGAADCASPAKSAYPTAEVLTAITSEFGANNPRIMSLMTNVTFTNYQMSEVLAWQEGNNASAEEAAVYYLNSYKDIWTDWLDDDARTKLDALIN